MTLSSTDLDEQLSCAFVLSSALYFRLANVDLGQLDPKLSLWLGLLHDTARDLAALSEPARAFGAGPEHFLRGIEDQRHTLRDLADAARQLGDTQLSEDLQRWHRRFDAQIEYDQKQTR